MLGGGEVYFYLQRGVEGVYFYLGGGRALSNRTAFLAYTQVKFIRKVV